jgi:hypothetical protein
MSKDQAEAAGAMVYREMLMNSKGCEQWGRVIELRSFADERLTTFRESDLVNIVSRCIYEVTGEWPNPSTEPVK